MIARFKQWRAGNTAAPTPKKNNDLAAIVINEDTLNDAEIAKEAARQEASQPDFANTNSPVERQEGQVQGQSDQEYQNQLDEYSDPEVEFLTNYSNTLAQLDALKSEEKPTPSQEQQIEALQATLKEMDTKLTEIASRDSVCAKLKRYADKLSTTAKVAFFAGMPLAANIIYLVHEGHKGYMQGAKLDTDANIGSAAGTALIPTIFLVTSAVIAFDAIDHSLKKWRPTDLIKKGLHTMANGFPTGFAYFAAGTLMTAVGPLLAIGLEDVVKQAAYNAGAHHGYQGNTAFSADLTNERVANFAHTMIVGAAVLSVVPAAVRATAKLAAVSCQKLTTSARGLFAQNQSTIELAKRDAAAAPARPESNSVSFSRSANASS